MRVTTKVVLKVQDERGRDEFVEFTVEGHLAWNEQADRMLITGTKLLSLDGGWSLGDFSLEDLSPRGKVATEEALADAYWEETARRHHVDQVQDLLSKEAA